MINLLKSDFYRLKKDKSSWVGLIIIMGLSIFTYLMTFGLEAIDPNLAAGLLNPRSVYLSSFQGGNNAGLLVLIIIGIVIAKDFSHKTIRQKILNGHTRKNIYLSHLVVSLTYGLSIVLISGLFSLLLMTATFGYGSVITGNEVLKLLASTGLGLLIISVYISLAVFIAMFFQSTGATIGVLLAVLFGGSFIISLVLAFSMVSTFPSWLATGLKIFPTTNAVWLVSFQLDLKGVLFTAISSLLYIIGLNLLGVHLFTNKDIK